MRPGSPGRDTPGKGEIHDSHIACRRGRRPTETRTTYYHAPAPAYTSGYYVAPVVTVREPRYYNYYSPGYYDSYGVWRTERATY